MRILYVSLVTLLMLLALPAYSAWQLDSNQSYLTFVSIKKGTVAESHRFTQFTGLIKNSGTANVTIDLNSLDTNIAIRDERMAKFLFETSQFSQARFTTQLNNQEIEAIATGESKKMSLKGLLNLHGQAQELMLSVLVTKVSTTNIMVTTLQPVIVKAEDFDLVAGINKLKSLANLPSIAYSVPVNFVLSFEK